MFEVKEALRNTLGSISTPVVHYPTHCPDPVDESHVFVFF